MTDLARVKAAIPVPAIYAGPSQLEAGVLAIKRVVVIDQRELSRGCLTSWLGQLGEEFDIAGIADAKLLHRPDLARCSAVILSAGAGRAGEGWLEQQADWLRVQRPEVPIVAIFDSDSAVQARELIARLSLQGHIPTSSTLEIAKAALRLIFVGGSYSPAAWSPVQPLNGARHDPVEVAASAAPKLTPRETRVLELLMQGMANKIIAYRLGMSQSTVKVHVHSIIRKFNVRNRTEVAVAARDLRKLP